MRFNKKRYSSTKGVKFGKGFTLIELLTSLLVAGVLAGIAIPSLFSFIQNSRLSTDINQLVTSMNLARSEAVKRGANIRVTATDSSSTTNEWGKGWSVWIDSNADSTMDANEVIATDQALNDSMQLNSTTDRNLFVFRADGSLIGATDTITLCDTERTGETGRSISISVNGRVNLNATYSCP